METYLDLLKNLPLWQLFIFGYIVGYGCMLGVMNFFLKLVCLVSTRTYTQNGYGKLLDVLWVTLIVIFTVLVL